MDINNSEYKQYLKNIKNILEKDIILYGVKYHVKSSIFHLDNNHFTYAVFNIDENIILSLKKNKNFYHDD